MNATQADSLERWSEPLTADERGALLETVALAVRRRGLQTPALFFIEMNRPLGFTACQGLIALAPFIAPLLGLDRVQKLGRLLADPRAVDELVTRLESPGAVVSGQWSVVSGDGRQEDTATSEASLTTDHRPLTTDHRPGGEG